MARDSSIDFTVTQGITSSQMKNAPAATQKAVQSNVELHRIQVGLALERKQVAEALKQAQKLVREDSKNADELLWMADVLAAAKQPAEAEQKYDAAYAEWTSELRTRAYVEFREAPQ